MTALWGYAAAYGAAIPCQFSVAAPGTSGSVVVIDGMGNAATVPYTNGQVALTLGDLPQYVVSTDLAVITPQVTTPEGYAPSL